MALERLTRIGSTGISTTASIVTHNINSTGIVTATEFYGGGSNLTGISGGGGGGGGVSQALAIAYSIAL